MDECLFGEPLPTDPCALLKEWLDNAREHDVQRNWNTMMLATVNAEARPTVRAVLHKTYDPKTGELVFYTNYRSRKAREMEAHPNVGVCMHWDHLERQVRIDGRVETVPPEVSDAYFATRDRESQIGAWASHQSDELEGWEELLGRVLRYGTKYAKGPIPRPPHWGGYRIIPHWIEFWHGRSGRIHERVGYERDPESETGWRSYWLNP